MMHPYTLEQSVVTTPPITEVVLLKGDKALDHLKDTNFQVTWKTLFQACDWCTVFQSLEFVSSWYYLYEHQYLPIVVIAKAAGQTVGIVALAKERGKKFITGAGDLRADYHCWLCEAPYGQAFIKAALTKVEQEFPRHEIRFTYLPPNTPLAWVGEDPYWNQKSVLKSYKRLLMDFEVPDRDKLLYSNGFRKKVERLSKLGKVSFERLTGQQDFQRYFPIFADQFDMRKGALENVFLFRKHSVTEQHLSALFEQGLLYFTVMKVGKEVVATHIGLLGKEGWYHGLFNTHAPHYGKYSPGIVSFLMLAQRLAQEGLQQYDLGPGHHAYKLRLSNADDEIYQLRVFEGLEASFKKALFYYLRRTCEYVAAKTGVDLRIVKSRQVRRLMIYKEQLAVIRQQGLGSTIPQPHKDRRHMVYVAEADHLVSSAESALSINKGMLGDLLCVDEAEGRFSRREFLGDAMKRLEAGEIPLTWAEAEKLLACAWVRSAPEGKEIEGLYIHRSVRAHSNAFLVSVLGDLAKYAQGKKLFVVTEKSEESLIGALEKAGFKPQAAV